MKAETRGATGRIPPQNLEAEASVLGSLLIDREAIVKVADFLRPLDFYGPAHQAIYGAMLELYERHEPIDLLSVTNRLAEKKALETAGGETVIASLAAGVPTAGHVAHYAKIVQKKATLRRLISSAAEISELGFTEEEEVDRVLDAAEQKLFAVSQQHLHSTFIPVKDVLVDAFQRIDVLHKGGAAYRGIPTGFKPLDDLLSGLQRADLVILAARPSVGKTSLALDVARHVAIREHVPVGIFSLEMSKEQLADRFICAEAGVDLWKMRTGRLSEEGHPHDDFSKINHALAVLAEAPIFIDDSATSNVLEIRTLARRLQAEHGIGFLVVDYLQLMEGPRADEGRVQEVSQISRALKSLARELNMPVLAVSQLSRAVEGRSPPVPKLSDLRDSGCVTGDTLIPRADTGELVRIDDLANRERQLPIPVFALDEHLKLVVRPLVKAFPSGRKMVYELRTRTGRTIQASANHPFYHITGWKRLDELRIGDRVALPRRLEPARAPNPLSDEELVLLAHLIGDGCTVPRQPIHYTSADRENLQTVESAARRLFGITPRRVRQDNWWHTYLPTPYPLTHGRHNPIVHWLTRLGVGLRRACEKEIPYSVFQSSSDRLALFLRHLWATDGNISWKYTPGRQPAASIYYATSSRKLADGVQHVLLRLGIHAPIRRVQQRGYRPMYHVHVEGSPSQQRFFAVAGVVGARSTSAPQMIAALRRIRANTNVDVVPREAWRTHVEREKDRVGWGWREVSAALQTAYCGSTLMKHGIGRERMMRLARALPRATVLQDLATSDIFWDAIVEIRPVGVRPVYDATVSVAHNFVANDFIIHNSIEQDADVVLFLYPRGRHEKTAENPNLIDVIIAKHRNGPVGTISLFFRMEQASFAALDSHHLGVPRGVPAAAVSVR